MPATTEKLRTLAVRFHLKFLTSEDVYRVVPLAPDPKVRRAAWRFEKLANDGRTVIASYDVSLDLQGYWACECLGWLRYGDRKPCRHVASLMAFVGSKG